MTANDQARIGPTGPIGPPEDSFATTQFTAVRRRRARPPVAHRPRQPARPDHVQGHRLGALPQGLRALLPQRQAHQDRRDRLGQRAVRRHDQEGAPVPLPAGARRALPDPLHRHAPSTTRRASGSATATSWSPRPRPCASPTLPTEVSSHARSPRRAARALAHPPGRPRAPGALRRHGAGLARAQRLHGLRVQPHRLAVQRRRLRLAAGRRDARSSSPSAAPTTASRRGRPTARAWPSRPRSSAATSSRSSTPTARARRC